MPIALLFDGYVVFCIRLENAFECKHKMATMPRCVRNSFELRMEQALIGVCVLCRWLSSNRVRAALGSCALATSTTHSYRVCVFRWICSGSYLNVSRCYSNFVIILLVYTY
jgi:hypothetical protein